MLSKESIKKYEAGFDYDDPIDPIGDEEWLFSEKNSNNKKLVFLGYDANLWPMPNFSKRTDRLKSTIVNLALERTKDFEGEVWLDDVQIK